jgi:hypothetical protein
VFIGQNTPKNIKIGWEMDEIQPISMIFAKLGIFYSFPHQKNMFLSLF